MERHLNTKKPISIVMAIPDHPWTKATTDAAAVRIAMTVGEAGTKDGSLRKVVHEDALDTDTPIIEFHEYRGTINSDLTVGADITAAVPLKANDGVCSPGVKLHGAGFIVTPNEAAHLGLGKRPGIERHIRDYRNGRDLTSRSRDVMVIDLDGLQVEEVRRRFPEVYQHLLVRVKPERDTNNEEYRRVHWWLFGRRNTLMRGFTANLQRYIATVETTKHRVFQFLDSSILPDNMIVAIGSDDAFNLGILSSRFHVVWTLAQGGTLEDRPRYTKSHCFDPFPFPSANDFQKQPVRATAEDIDAHRKRVLSEHPHLTLTGLYNVLDKLRTGIAPNALEAGDRRIFDDGLVLVLKELHDRLDAAVAEAYGWPVNLSDEEILTRLVTLNKERAQEEARGVIRWLRPEYQIPRFGSAIDRQAAAESGTQIAAELPIGETAQKPSFPTADVAQTAAVMAALAASATPVASGAIASTFRQGRRIEAKVRSVLSALSRMGFVATNDGGESFFIRRAA
jgi:hypothetical protein